MFTARLFGGEGRDILTGQFDHTRCRCFKTGQHAHHCRLATTGRTQQGKKLFLKDIERQIVDGRETAELFCNRLEADQRFLRWIGPWFKNGLVHDMSLLTPQGTG